MIAGRAETRDLICRGFRALDTWTCTIRFMGLMVWIDQDLCTGDGLCVEVCPALFGMHDDGLAYVMQEAWPSILGPDGAAEPVLQMAAGLADVPDHLVDSAVEAAEDCPGECIFIEVSDT